VTEGSDSNSHAPQGARHGAGTSRVHVPVLLQQAIDLLNVRRGGTIWDATLGLGGHSFELAKRLGREGHLIGCDRDEDALRIARKRLTHPPEDLAKDWPKLTLMHGSFAEVGKQIPPGTVDGVLADVGVSSMQFDEAARGFSFQADGPLDMRMDRSRGETAEQVVNHMSEEELANVIYEYGEERRSRRIARAIVRARPVKTTAHLAEVISAAARTMKHSRIHPATQTFQALRIFVNRELDELAALVSGKTAAAPLVLRKAGRLVVISFHSLEDRIVKDAMRQGQQEGWLELLTKKPVTASEEEIDRNPRSRSAKLRAAEKV
jgi:16S rRNA (cytosine1402-N4)-methyltransferase